MTYQRIPAEAVTVGDIVVGIGRSEHRIDTIRPYTHPTVEGAFAIAKASDGWGIGLWHGERIEVDR